MKLARRIGGPRTLAEQAELADPGRDPRRRVGAGYPADDRRARARDRHQPDARARRAQEARADGVRRVRAPPGRDGGAALGRRPPRHVGCADRARDTRDPACRRALRRRRPRAVEGRSSGTARLDRTRTTPPPRRRIATSTWALRPVRLQLARAARRARMGPQRALPQLRARRPRRTPEQLAAEHRSILEACVATTRTPRPASSTSTSSARRTSSPQKLVGAPLFGLDAAALARRGLDAGRLPAE